MAPLECRRLEQPAVEIRNAAEPARNAIAIRMRRVEAAEEQRRKHLRIAVARGEAVEEESPLLVEPALLLDEGEKQQARENQERLGVARFPRLLGHEGAGDILDRIAKAFEEAAGDALAIEGEIEHAGYVLARGEEVEAVEGMSRRAREIDVQPTQGAAGEIINSDTFISTFNQR